MDKDQSAELSEWDTYAEARARRVARDRARAGLVEAEKLIGWLLDSSLAIGLAFDAGGKEYATEEERTEARAGEQVEYVLCGLEELIALWDPTKPREEHDGTLRERIREERTAMLARADTAPSTDEPAS